MKKKRKKSPNRFSRFIIGFLLLFLLVNVTNIARFFYPVAYTDYIKHYAAEYDVDPYLIMSIIKAESNFNPDAVSGKNAAGLMQIMEPTARWLASKMNMTDFKYENIKDPKLNIEMGCYYVAYLLKRFNGNTQNAIAAYNAGEGNVLHWLKDETCSKDEKNLFHIPFPETRHYVVKVMNNVKTYRSLYSLQEEDIGDNTTEETEKKP